MLLRWPRPRASWLLAIGLVALASGCAGGDEGASSTTRPGVSSSIPASTVITVPAGVSLVAQSDVSDIEVFAAPYPSAAVRPTHVLHNPTKTGSPLVFLVNGRAVRGDWVPVYLPVRPNGSVGFVRADLVRISTNEYRISVELSGHRLTITRLGQPVLETDIGVGTDDTPTPGGIYYIKELLEPPDPYGVYGPYAYGLSGFSNELESFNGGTGVIGIHGTNDPSSIGRDISHGCIRVTNQVVTRMAKFVPLGTPVEILS